MQLIKLYGKRISRVAVCLLGLAAMAAIAAAAGIKEGEKFPDLGGFKLEGKLPDDLKGKVVMIDFWASWCEPCKASFPAMDELQKRYAGQGLQVIAVNVDENKADMDEFLKKHPASFAVVRDAKQKLVDKANISTMPSSFLVDREGRVRFVHSGFRGEETSRKYAEEIESLLKK